MAGPPQSNTSTNQSTVEIIVLLFLAGAIGLALMMLAALLLSIHKILVLVLFGLAILGSGAAEMVDVIGKTPAPKGAHLLGIYVPYVRSFNVARFVWRLISWSILAVAGLLAVEIAKDGPQSICPGHNGLQISRIEMIATIIVALISGIMGVVLVVCWMVRQCGWMRDLRTGHLGAGLLLFAGLALLIGGLFSLRCP